MTWMTNQSIALAFALVVSACLISVMPVKAESAQEATHSTQNKLVAIESIIASGEGDAAELTIKLSAPTTYTSYKTTAPLKFVVDLSQATQGSIVSPLVLNKGNFKSAAVSRYDTDAGVMTRVEIELVKDVDAVLSTSKENPGELKITFPASAVPSAVLDVPATTASATASAVPAESSTPAAVSTTEHPSVSDVVTEPTQIATPVTTRTLTSITARNSAIILAINGGAGNFKSFRLSKPDRYVIDLFDVKSSIASRIIPVNAAGVSSARLGVYPDKLRVVFDAVNGSFPKVTAAKTIEGVEISLNRKSADENPNTHLMASQNVSESSGPDKSLGMTTESTEKKSLTPEPIKDVPPPASEKKVNQSPSLKKDTRTTAPASVEMIDFQVVDGLSRVAVKVSGEITADAPLKSPGFVTLTIKNATLPKRLQRSLETKGFISPILRITPIIVKSRSGADIKIRIAMRRVVPYEYRQEGDMLFVDFKNPENITADNTKEPSAQITKQAKPSVGKEAELSTELVSHAEPSAKPLDASKSYKGRKVTLEFADAEVRKIFQLLSEVSNKNFVLGDDVTGTISIKLVNVPWDQALDIILDTKGLDKREDGNIIIIKGKGKFKSQAEEDNDLKKAQLKNEIKYTEFFAVNYTEAETLKPQLEGLLTQGIGVINADKRTNTIIVNSVRSDIDRVKSYLAKMDVPEKQVMIEARIVEATSTFTRSLGVNWGVHYRDGSASFLGINSLDTGFGGLTTAPATSGVGASSGINTGISFGTLTSNVQLDMRLSAAASAGLVKIVSTPKVATLNNKSAKITQGQQIPYTSSTSDKVETKFIEAALSLEVTPHINANGTIGLKIDAKNDSPGQVAAGSTAPAINKKQATTEMLLRDGETTVIGGIYVDNDSESDDGVPFLMDIPLLGKLFKTSNKSKTKTELLIFITPRILGAI